MKPADYQIDASQFLFERNHSMLFARTGTGKTLVNLLAIQDWLEAKEAKRVLVVPPKRVAKLVWRQERDKWQIPITMSLATGEQTKAEQRDAIDADTQCLIANYEIAVKLIEENTHGCNTVVFDELSKLRNATGKRQKSARRGGFDIWTGCTGTPAPNGLTSIYGMAQAVGLGALVGRNHDHWLRRYFYPTDFQQRVWAPFKETPAELADLIRPYTYVLEDDKVELGDIVRPPIDVELPRPLRILYDRMRAESVLTDEEIVAGSAGVLRNKLRQIASGFAYKRDGEAVPFDGYRMDTVADIVEEMQGRPIIIAYEFREQIAMMRRKWPDLRWLGGDSTDDARTIDLWNEGRLDKIALHPASAGHGLNLQGAKADALVWWQLPDDLELYLQTIGRLVRRGGADRVWSYEITALNTVDVQVRHMAGLKNQTQDSLWAALRR